METLLENVIFFLFISFVMFAIFYYYILKPSLKYKNVKAPSVVLIILYGYKIDLNVINYKKMLLEISLSSSLIIATFSTIFFYFIDRIVIASILILICSLVSCLIAYSFIGRKYEKITRLESDEELEYTIIKKRGYTKKTRKQKVGSDEEEKSNETKTKTVKKNVTSDSNKNKKENSNNDKNNKNTKKVANKNNKKQVKRNYKPKGNKTKSKTKNK